MLVATMATSMAQPMTPLCNVSALAGMHSIQLLRQLSDPRRCPGAAARLPTDGTDGGLVIDGGTANDAEDAVQWLRVRPDWRAIGFEPNRAECQRANATLAASARGKAKMESKLVEHKAGLGQRRRAGYASARECPGRHLRAASLGQLASCELVEKTRPTKVRPELRRVGFTRATACPRPHLGAASLGQSAFGPHHCWPAVSGLISTWRRT